MYSQGGNVLTELATVEDSGCLKLNMDFMEALLDAEEPIALISVLRPIPTVDDLFELLIRKALGDFATHQMGKTEVDKMLTDIGQELDEMMDGEKSTLFTNSSPIFVKQGDGSQVRVYILDTVIPERKTGEHNNEYLRLSGLGILLSSSIVFQVENELRGEDVEMLVHYFLQSNVTSAVVTNFTRQLNILVLDSIGSIGLSEEPEQLKHVLRNASIQTLPRLQYLGNAMKCFNVPSEEHHAHRQSLSLFIFDLLKGDLHSHAEKCIQDVVEAATNYCSSMRVIVYEEALCQMDKAILENESTAPPSDAPASDTGAGACSSQTIFTPTVTESHHLDEEDDASKNKCFSSPPHSMSDDLLEEICSGIRDMGIGEHDQEPGMSMDIHDLAIEKRANALSQALLTFSDDSDEDDEEDVPITPWRPQNDVNEGHQCTEPALEQPRNAPGPAVPSMTGTQDKHFFELAEEGFDVVRHNSVVETVPSYNHTNTPAILRELRIVWDRMIADAQEMDAKIVIENVMKGLNILGHSVAGDAQGMVSILEEEVSMLIETHNLFLVESETELRKFTDERTASQIASMFVNTKLQNRTFNVMKHLAHELLHSAVQSSAQIYINISKKNIKVLEEALELAMTLVIPRCREYVENLMDSENPDLVDGQIVEDAIQFVEAAVEEIDDDIPDNRKRAFLKDVRGQLENIVDTKKEQQKIELDKKHMELDTLCSQVLKEYEEEMKKMESKAITTGQLQEMGSDALSKLVRDFEEKSRAYKINVVKHKEKLMEEFNARVVKMKGDLEIRLSKKPNPPYTAPRKGAPQENIYPADSKVSPGEFRVPETAIGVHFGLTGLSVYAWTNGDSQQIFGPVKYLKFDQGDFVIDGSSGIDLTKYYKSVESTCIWHGNESLEAEDLMAIAFVKLSQMAEAKLLCKVTMAIIIVPAFFGDTQKKVLRSALGFIDLKCKIYTELDAAARCIVQEMQQERRSITSAAISIVRDNSADVGHFHLTGKLVSRSEAEAMRGRIWDGVIGVLKEAIRGKTPYFFLMDDGIAVKTRVAISNKFSGPTRDLLQTVGYGLSLLCKDEGPMCPQQTKLDHESCIRNIKNPCGKIRILEPGDVQARKYALQNGLFVKLNGPKAMRVKVITEFLADMEKTIQESRLSAFAKETIQRKGAEVLVTVQQINVDEGYVSQQIDKLNGMLRDFQLSI